MEGTHGEKSAARFVHETAGWGLERPLHLIRHDILNHRWEEKKTSSAPGGYRDMGFSTATQVINLCSHDEVRPEHEIKPPLRKHIPKPKGMTLQMYWRAWLAGAAFAAPGVPMIYAWQEFGDDTAQAPSTSRAVIGSSYNPSFARTWRRQTVDPRAGAICPAQRQHQLPDNHFAAEHLVRFCRCWDDNGGTLLPH
ncbi:MAG: hypothetical protein H6639_16070 [Caldilineaceae bacterium]|nr:hypothetical protein [Caldilineaceae bacterium]